MAKEMQSVGLCSNLRNLAIRVHAQQNQVNQENVASTSSHQYFEHSLPKQMREVTLRTERPRIRSILVVPADQSEDTPDLSENQVMEKGFMN